MAVWYATREDVKSSLDINETARNNAQVDRAIESASRSVEALTHRRFYPCLATRYFNWPNQTYSRSYRLWLEEDEVISVSSLSSGGTAISAPNFFLEPVNYGPPFHSIELNLGGSSSSFGGGNTHQHAIAVTGLFGYNAELAPAGLLVEALDSSETAIDVSDGNVGVGSILKVDDEYMVVTEKSPLNIQAIQADLAANASAQTVSVTTGSAFIQGEVILVDAERMKILDIAGNNLVVKRAWDGSTLASHSGSDIYAYRTLTVTRGALGSSPATHLLNAPISRHVVPALVKELCIAEAINSIQQETSGYARAVGSGDSLREASGRGLSDIRKAAYAAYGRLRTGAI